MDHITLSVFYWFLLLFHSLLFVCLALASAGSELRVPRDNIWELLLAFNDPCLTWIVYQSILLKLGLGVGTHFECLLFWFDQIFL